MAKEMGGEELATPRTFTYLSDEDSEDHLDHHDEDNAGEIEQENTGDHDTTIEGGEQEPYHENPPEEARTLE